MGKKNMKSSKRIYTAETNSVNWK